MPSTRLVLHCSRAVVAVIFGHAYRRRVQSSAECCDPAHSPHCRLSHERHRSPYPPRSMESPQHDEKASKTDYAGSEVVATVSSSKSSGGVEVRHQFALADIDTAALLAMETVPVTPEQDRALLRKIDWVSPMVPGSDLLRWRACVLIADLAQHLLPFMLALYALQFLAKTSLGLSVLLDLKTQTGVSTAQYNILSTIFYVSYLVFEYPQSLGLQRYPVGKYLAWNIIAWSVLLCLHAACTNFTGLVIVRFLLGIAEGSITPGFLIITSQYYTASEQSQRVGAWFLMNGTAIILGGLLTYGLLHVGATALAAWRVLFLIGTPLPSLPPLVSIRR